jgi:hypothetical protein
MVLGSTQSLTEMSTGIFPGGKGGRCVRLTNVPLSCTDFLKSGSLNLLEPLGPVKASNGIALNLPSLLIAVFFSQNKYQNFPNPYLFFVVYHRPSGTTLTLQPRQHFKP